MAPETSLDAELEMDDPAADVVTPTSREAAVNTPVRRRSLKSQLHRLTPFHSLPETLRDNEYITKYYRVNYSGRQTIRSLFGLHNETANIWSHFLGFMVFAGLTLLTIYARPAPVTLGAHKLVQLEELLLSAGRSGWQEVLRAERSVGAGLRSVSSHIRECGWDCVVEDLKALEDRVLAYGSDGLKGMEHRYAKLAASLVGADWPTRRWPIHVFTAGAMTCLFTSSFCHLFGCCSWHFAQSIWKYDYAGIVVLIVTSFVPPVFYGFLCQPFLRNFYLVSTVGLGLFTTCVTLLSFFQTKEFRAFRASLFACLGLWGIAPAMHALWLHGGHPEVRTYFLLDMCMGAVYLLGAAIYALRVPERWKPGAFDLWFSSHNLFHLCVVTAALVHYVGVRVLLDWRDSTGGCKAW